MKKNLLIISFYLLAVSAFSQAPGGVNTGLKVWLRADAGTSTTTNGSPVAAWNDQSGTGHHHIQATTANQPTYVGAGGSYLMNYNPAIRFAGIGDLNANNDYFTATNYLAPTDAVHVFAVSRDGGSNGTVWKVLYGFTADVDDMSWYLEQISGRVGFVEKPNTSLNVLYGLSSFLMPKSGNQRVIWNGTTQSFANTAYNITSAASPSFVLGADVNNTNPMVGDIQEMIVYAGAAGADLPAATIAQVQSYLAIKYGISLDSTGQADYTASDGVTKFWTGTSNIAYRNDIFGLGRDDASALNQKQAFSYGDSAMTIYLGSLSSLNSGNASSIAADKSFLMLGDNGFSGFSTTANYPSGTLFANGTSSGQLNSLSNCIWKAQATTQGSWTVNINANKYTNSDYVMVSNSPAFIPGSTRIYAITGGTANNVVINNGDYIAYAKFQLGPGGVTGYEIWLKADAGTSTTTNGAAVSAWNDQSGNAKHHTQATAANQPTYVGAGGSYLMNYNPAVRFDGTNDIMTGPSFASGFEALHIYTVSRLNNAASISWNEIYSLQGNTTVTTWYNNTPGIYQSGNYLAAAKSGTLYGLNSFLMPKNGQDQVIWNGTVTNVTGTNNYAYNGTSFAIGGDLNNNNYLNGDIQEVIAFKTGVRWWPFSGVSMSSNHVQRIQSYLALKYGISLDPTDQADYIASDNSTQFWTGASNIGYQNNIFGLGRDDNSSLDQKQAYSMGDSSISIFDGTLAPLNNLNASTTGPNYSFLMLGDNNLTGYTPYGSYPVGTAFMNMSIPTILNIRTNRIWKSQTSTQTQWKIGINTNKYPGTTYVLVSSSSSFTPASTRIYPVVSGTANNVIINNAEFVALASLDKSPGGVSANLTAWFKADADVYSDVLATTPSTNGANVAAWKNQVTNGAIGKLTQASGTTGKYLSTAELVNFNPSIKFVGTSGNGLTAAVNIFGGAATGFHLIATAKDMGAGWTDIMGNGFGGKYPAFAIRYSGSFNNWNLYTGCSAGYNGGSATMYNGGGAGGSASNYGSYATAFANKQPQIFGASATGMTTLCTSTLDSWVDGFKQTTASTATTTGINANEFYVGSSTGGGAWNGYIPEVIAYKERLTDADMNRVNTYVAIKYGITLGQGGNAGADYRVGENRSKTVYTATNGSTKIWDPVGIPTLDNFRWHIAGIGRDDLEGLNQKQTSSVNYNPIGQVTLSLGLLAATNAANTNIFVADNTYLVYGDNGIATSLATASTVFTTPDGLTSNIRMNRVWAAQSTHFSQVVQVTIPATMIGAVTTTACQKLRLVVASDPGFTNIISYKNNLTLNGGNYSCNYKFPDGVSYFTFARVEIGAEGFTFLPTVNTPSVCYSTCEENGWRYWYADGTQGLNIGTKQIFAINRNGNGTASTLNAFSGLINYQPSSYDVSNGTNATHIMGRLLTVTDGNASPPLYTTNGGMQVRFYIDSNEINALLASAVSSKWFKHSGNLSATLADQTPTTINNAQFYGTVAAGTEDSLDYVQFNGVQSFSTFGFLTNENLVTLPIKLLSFDATFHDSQHALLTWQTTGEDALTGFTVQRSADGIIWQTIGLVTNNNNPTGTTYKFTDPVAVTNTVYYRLKITDGAGNYTYSDTRVLKAGNSGEGNYIVYPNPASAQVFVSWNNSQLKPVRFQLYNIQGQLMAISFKQNTNGLTFDLGSLPRGIYELKLENTSGRISVQKITKQ